MSLKLFTLNSKYIVQQVAKKSCRNYGYNTISSCTTEVAKYEILQQLTPDFTKTRAF